MPFSLFPAKKPPNRRVFTGCGGKRRLTGERPAASISRKYYNYCIYTTYSNYNDLVNLVSL
jgi:hypothetical protein